MTNAQQNFQLNREQASKIVCNIRTPINDSIYIGTGFFITDSTRAFLITANHIAISINNQTILAVDDLNGNCTTFFITTLNEGLTWKHHAIADISIMELEINDVSRKLLEGRCLPINCINLGLDCVSRDTELTSIGFPSGLGVQGRFSPLTFRSFASSNFLTLNRFDTNTLSDFFCLENPSVGGYSGGPVMDLGIRVVGSLTTSTGKSVCHGVMHGTISDNTGGKIALVTPTFYLKDLLSQVGL